MALEFNPNNPSKQKNRPVWATYIPERRTSSRFKQHTNRGHALNAMGITTSGCILYHWEDVLGENGEISPEWVEVARIEGEEPDNCERCDTPFEVKDYGYGKPYKTGVYGLWVGKPKLRYVTVCRDCEMDILYPRYDPPRKRKWDGYLMHWNTSNKRKVDDREL